jgi:branched-chain amino acid transport system ATP-binding protein
MTALLELRGVRAGYDGSSVLNGLDICVDRGEIVCLLGANGAGKSTTMRVVTGLIKPFEGSISFDGNDLLSVPNYKRINLGLSLSPEGRWVFPNLNVEEHLKLGSYVPRARSHRTQSLSEVYELFPRLHERRRQAAGLMSGGEQQMLAIGRALMSRPTLLMLDEPSLGLAPVIVSALLKAVAKIAQSGISVLLVEQNARAALSISDRGYVVSSGQVVSMGSSRELAASDLVKEAFLGAENIASDRSTDASATRKDT